MVGWSICVGGVWACNDNEGKGWWYVVAFCLGLARWPHLVGAFRRSRVRVRSLESNHGCQPPVDLGF